MKRHSTEDVKIYNLEKDLEYTKYILVIVLICCGFEDINPANHTIDEVVESIKSVFNTNLTLSHSASNEIIANTQDWLLRNYRRFWFNYQLIMGAQQYEY